MSRSPSRLSLDALEDNYSCTEEPESLDANERKGSYVEPDAHHVIQGNKTSIEPGSFNKMGPGDFEETEPGYFDATEKPRFAVAYAESCVRHYKTDSRSLPSPALPEEDHDAIHAPVIIDEEQVPLLPSSTLPQDEHDTVQKSMVIKQQTTNDQQGQVINPLDPKQARGRTIYALGDHDYAVYPPQVNQTPRPIEDYFTKMADGTIVWVTVEEETTTPPMPQETPREILRWINSLIDHHREKFSGFTAEEEDSLWIQFKTVDIRCELCKRTAGDIYELHRHLNNCDRGRTGRLAMDKKRRLRWTDKRRKSDVWYSERL